MITGFPFHDESEALDARLRRFLDEGEAPVVFTLGSAASAVPRHFFHQSLLAIAKLKCRAVLIVGNYAPEQFEGSLPTNVAAFPYAPYSELFRRGAANVHHGGIGTTAQALRAGRPMLVVPFAFDQPDNAARAVELGVACSIPIHHYTAPGAAKQLEKLLHDPQYGERAAAVGKKIGEENGVVVAATKLEKLLE